MPGKVRKGNIKEKQMFRKIEYAVTVLLIIGCTSAFGADRKMKFTLEDAMMYGEVRDLMEGHITMSFGENPNMVVEEKFGTFKTSKRTNAFRKEAGDACAHALASALISLQERAEREGGNAVVDIMSNIQNHEESSTTEYSCLVGSMMVNVALKGTVVNIKK